jgi:two-component system chemotaxis sensor kinase CheA
MSENDGLEEGLQAFVEESKELLELAEQTLLQLEDSPDDADLIGELFRSIHTIKGSSGIFGFEHVVAFTHVAESVMGRAREGEVSLSKDLISILLDARDHIATLLECALGDTELSAESIAKGEQLLSSLTHYLGETVAAKLSPELASEVTVSEGETMLNEESAVTQEQSVANDCWHLSLRLSQGVLQGGMDPSSFFRYLATVGDIVTMTTIEGSLPDYKEMNPEDCYLGFEIDLRSAATKEEIAAVFEFIEDDCSLHILPPNSSLSKYRQLISELPEEKFYLGEILVKSGALTYRELLEVLAAQDTLRQDLLAGEDDGNSDDDKNNSQIVPTLGEIAIDKGMVSIPIVDAALEKQQQVKTAQLQQQQTIRVSPQKLGNLIDFVGELVIASAHINVQAKNNGDDTLVESSENMAWLVDQIRSVSLGLRMVPIGDTFNRYKRIVRDLSKGLNKDIDFQIEGGDTELDKTVVEKIVDPLMHMVRNAVDHGVETSDMRIAAGKPKTATLLLRAAHEAGSISIEISDDGRGLDREKILAKAKQNDLLKSDQVLSDKEVYRLIFEPGFSTAEEVSNISGRGVGMDVVRRNVEGLRGQIDVTSTLGKGSTFTIRLPLTLAIIDGFQVNVSGTSYIIPLGMIDECIELNSKLHTHSGGNYINLRGEVLPYVRLNELFNDSSRKSPQCLSQSNAAIGSKNSDRENIVVVQYAGKKAGLVVDELLGEQQAVIKPLGKIFQNLDCISGATILGGGDVAMIVDVPKLLSLAN